MKQAQEIIYFLKNGKEFPYLSFSINSSFDSLPTVSIFHYLRDENGIVIENDKPKTIYSNFDVEDIDGFYETLGQKTVNKKINIIIKTR